MKLPVLHKYCSVNVFLYILLTEFLITTYAAFTYFLVSNMFFFLTSMLSLLVIYILHLYISPICIIVILVELILRYTKHIIKENNVTLNKKQQYIIYSIAILTFVVNSCIHYIYDRPLTEEELRYD